MLRPKRTIAERCARFFRARSGAAAVEFALIAPFFFLLLFGMCEISLIGFAQVNLDSAAFELARGIRTGESENVSASTMQANLCTAMTQIMPVSCNNLYLDVKSFPSFVDASGLGLGTPIANGQLQTGTFGYSPGTASDIVVVRAYYQWHVVTPMFQAVFGNVGGSDRLLVSTIMFRSEPYK